MQKRFDLITFLRFYSFKNISRNCRSYISLITNHFCDTRKLKFCCICVILGNSSDNLQILHLVTKAPPIRKCIRNSYHSRMVNKILRFRISAVKVRKP